MKQIKVLGFRILVEPIDEEPTTDSGIIIPENARQLQNVGVVRGVGPGKLMENGGRVPIDVEVGDKVVYGKYSGTEVEHDGKVYVILGGADVLAVVDGE